MTEPDDLLRNEQNERARRAAILATQRKKRLTPSTVGELVAELLKLDQDMPLFSNAALGGFYMPFSFQYGKLEIANLKQLVGEPEHTVNADNPMWEQSPYTFTAPFKALIIGSPGT